MAFRLENLEISPIMMKVIITVCVITFFYILATIIGKIVNRRVADLKTKYNARRTVFYIITLLSFIAVVFIWIKDLSALSVVLSVIGAGLVLALQELILCIAGWFLITFKRPFDTGDRIEVAGVRGDVIDITFLQTSLLEIGNWVVEDQSTGRVVHVPNSSVFKGPVFNYTRGFQFIWNEIKIVVTFESNWEKAKGIVLRHAEQEADRIKEEVDRLIKRMSGKYLIYFDKLTPIVYVKIATYGVELSLRYLTEAKRRRTTQDAISSGILSDFEKERDINFAYETFRIMK